MNTKTILSILLFVVLIGAALFLFMRGRPNPEDVEEDMAITNFEECVAAGHPVQESYPARCSVPGGETFIQDIGNEFEKSDLIRSDAPRPGARLTSGGTLEISGEARGYWFFEGDFPFEIQDPSGKVLMTHYATAESEWMTEEFVPFHAEIVLETDYTGPATLVLKRNNPSDLRENDDELLVPVIIEGQSGQEDGRQGQTPVEGGDEVVGAGCFVGGCSSQICSDDPNVVSTCEWREEYGCYKTATCERQATGECGWTETEELRQCLGDTSSGNMLMPL